MVTRVSMAVVLLVARAETQLECQKLFVNFTVIWHIMFLSLPLFCQFFPNPLFGFVQQWSPNLQLICHSRWPPQENNRGELIEDVDWHAIDMHSPFCWSRIQIWTFLNTYINTASVQKSKYDVVLLFSIHTYTPTFNTVHALADVHIILLWAAIDVFYYRYSTPSALLVRALQWAHESGAMEHVMLTMHFHSICIVTVMVVTYT